MSLCQGAKNSLLWRVLATSDLVLDSAMPRRGGRVAWQAFSHTRANGEAWFHLRTEVVGSRDPGKGIAFCQ